MDLETFSPVREGTQFPSVPLPVNPAGHVHTVDPFTMLQVALTSHGDKMVVEPQ